MKNEANDSYERIFQAEEDPNIGLLTFRNELERRLRMLARKNSFEEARSLHLLVETLEEREVLPRDAANGIEKLLRLSQSAAQGARVSPETVWVLRENGPSVLSMLDRLLQTSAAD